MTTRSAVAVWKPLQLPGFRSGNGKRWVDGGRLGTVAVKFNQIRAGLSKQAGHGPSLPVIQAAAAEKRLKSRDILGDDVATAAQHDASQ